AGSARAAENRPAKRAESAGRRKARRGARRRPAQTHDPAGWICARHCDVQRHVGRVATRARDAREPAGGRVIASTDRDRYDFFFAGPTSSIKTPLGSITNAIMPEPKLVGCMVNSTF